MGHVVCLWHRHRHAQIVVAAVFLTPGGLIPLNRGAFPDCLPVGAGFERKRWNLSDSSWRSSSRGPVRVRGGAYWRDLCGSSMMKRSSRQGCHPPEQVTFAAVWRTLTFVYCCMWSCRDVIIRPNISGEIVSSVSLVSITVSWGAALWAPARIPPQRFGGRFCERRHFELNAYSCWQYADVEQVLTATVGASACRHLLISTNHGADLWVNGALINYANIRPVAQFGLSLITTVSTKMSFLRLWRAAWQSASMLWWIMNIHRGGSNYWSQFFQQHSFRSSFKWERITWRSQTCCSKMECIGRCCEMFDIDKRFIIWDRDAGNWAGLYSNTTLWQLDGFFKTRWAASWWTFFQNSTVWVSSLWINGSLRTHSWVFRTNPFLIGDACFAAWGVTAVCEHGNGTFLTGGRSLSDSVVPQKRGTFRKSDIKRARRDWPHLPLSPTPTAGRAEKMRSFKVEELY